MRWTLLILLTGASIASLSMLHGRESQSGNPAPSPSSAARTGPIARAIFATGTVEGSRRETPLRFEVVGRLESIAVSEGQTVQTGSRLAVLEADTWRHELSLAEANLRLAIAERDRLVNGARKETRELARAQARVAEARLAQARKRYDRTVVAKERYAAAQQELDDLEGNFRAAEAELEAAQARADEVQAPAREDEVCMADAKIALEQCRCDRARSMLAKTVLTAPCDGVILRVHDEPGELVGPESPEPCIVIVETREMRVRAYVEELDALRVSEGQRAYVAADGMPDTRFWGTIVSCAPSMVPKKLFNNSPAERVDVKVREVVIVLDEQDKLVIGLPVDVFIDPETTDWADRPMPRSQK